MQTTTVSFRQRRALNRCSMLDGELKTLWNATSASVFADPSLNLMDLNIARRLSNIRDTVTGIIRDLSRQQ